MNRPTAEEFNPFYAGYIATVPDDVLAELRRQQEAFPDFIGNITTAKADFAYAPGKWTIKELLGHIIDTERIMACRALCFARGETQGMPGFDENDYVAASHYNDRNLTSLAAEFASLRQANLFLFESLNEEELQRIGKASTHPVSVRALLFIMAGHVNHHEGVLKERYLND
ncbi:MAG: DinB family protein [Sphingobacteriaceae bacterium]